MTPLKLPNYLRKYRKRYGLSQRDVTFLLGWRVSGHVSRYERFSRVPDLQTSLALSVILQTGIPELFAGEQQKVERTIYRRALRLRARLSRNSRSKAAKRDLVERIISSYKP